MGIKTDTILRINGNKPIKTENDYEKSTWKAELYLMHLLIQKRREAEILNHCWMNNMKNHFFLLRLHESNRSN